MLKQSQSKKGGSSLQYIEVLKKLQFFVGKDGSLLRFISEYLKSRKKSLVIRGFVSSELPVLSGVPQGSILQPMLFVLFLNDIVKGLHVWTNITMYAEC